MAAFYPHYDHSYLLAQPTLYDFIGGRTEKQTQCISKITQLFGDSVLCSSQHTIKHSSSVLPNLFHTVPHTETGTFTGCWGKWTWMLKAWYNPLRGSICLGAYVVTQKQMGNHLHIPFVEGVLNLVVPKFSKALESCFLEIFLSCYCCFVLFCFCLEREGRGGTKGGGGRES